MGIWFGYGVCDGGFDQGLADSQWDDDPRNPANEARDEGIDEYRNDLYDEARDNELEVVK